VAADEFVRVGERVRVLILHFRKRHAVEVRFGPVQSKLDLGGTRGESEYALLFRGKTGAAN
jgi:hypothetical protein